MYFTYSSLKHEQQCFIRPDKARAASVLNGFKNEPFYEFIGEVILKINLIWEVKTSEKFIKNSERVFITYRVIYQTWIYFVLTSWIIKLF